MNLTSAHTSHRKREIVRKFISELDKYMEELKSGDIETNPGTKRFADTLYITPNHLGDTIKDALGQSICTIYQEKLLEVSKELLEDSARSIKEVAYLLNYDPSNFTKFFKRNTGLTPKQYRDQILNSKTVKQTI